MSIPDELRRLGEEAEFAEESWDTEETVTRRLPTLAPMPVRVSAAVWDSLPRGAKSWVFVAIFSVCASLAAYALHLGYVPWFLSKD